MTAMSNLNVLCRCCDGIFDTAQSMLLRNLQCDKSDLQIHYWRPGYHKVTGPFHSLSEWEGLALDSSCHLCAILYHLRNASHINELVAEGKLNRINFEVRRIEGNHGHAYVKLQAEGANQTIDGRYYPAYGSLQETAVVFSFDHSRNCSNPSPDLTVQSTSTWSRLAVEQLKTWMSICRVSHRPCDSPIQNSRLPLRLIDVDPNSTLSTLSQDCDELSQFSLNAMPKVRICSTSQLPPETRYLTLSHRWDEVPSVRLSYDTMTCFHTEIPPSLLATPESKTFRDAIEVVRCLGFRYLWIDAFCINQDDDGEKTSEISFMDQIYANGVANISATGATRAADGLFMDRNRLVMEPCRKTFTAHDGYEELYVVLMASFHINWSTCIIEAPINQRGWVFQERMLSPRVIHFTPHQIFWECPALQAAMSCPSGFSKDEIYGRPRKSDFVFKDQSGPAFDPPTGLPVAQTSESELWEQLVASYTRMDLTFPRDKLLAISALARRTAAKRQLQPEDYYAGLWYPDLLVSLLWYMSNGWHNDGLPLTSQVTEYIAPSWSWAAASARTSAPSPKNPTTLATVAEIATIPKDHDRFGEIQSGYIRLSTFLCQFQWHAEEQRVEIKINNGKILRPSTTEPLQQLTLQWDSAHLKTEILASNEYRILVPGGNLSISDNAFYLVPLYERQRSMDNANRIIHDNIDGLILHKTLEQGQYVRVGTFYTTARRDPDTGTAPSSEYITHLKEVVKQEESQEAKDSFFQWILEYDIREAVLGRLQPVEAANHLKATDDGQYLIEII